MEVFLHRGIYVGEKPSKTGHKSLDIKKKIIAVESERGKKTNSQPHNHIRILITFKFKNKLSKLLPNFFLVSDMTVLTISNF